MCSLDCHSIKQQKKIYIYEDENSGEIWLITEMLIPSLMESPSHTKSKNWSAL